MANFTGQLRPNEIMAGLHNMIISQSVFADNFTGLNRSFVEKFRTDGTLYGDTKLYYAADVLQSYPWGNYAEAINLLEVTPPATPDVQAITISNFRQIRYSMDSYLSKRAWGTEAAFSEFTTVMLGMIGETKAILDYTMLATFVGTAKSGEAKQNVTVTPGTGESDAQAISKALADLMVQLAAPSRDYNDFHNMRSFGAAGMEIIWNSDFVNSIKKIDEPMLRQLGEIVSPDLSNVLPPQYFGNVNAAGGTAPSGNATIRTLVEKDYGSVHCFPGDLVPGGATYAAKETYTVDPKVICKVIHKNSVPFMSAFEVGTSFFNARALVETNYLTWGYSDLEYLKQYPYITVKHA